MFVCTVQLYGDKICYKRKHVPRIVSVDLNILTIQQLAILTLDYIHYYTFIHEIFNQLFHFHFPPIISSWICFLPGPFMAYFWLHGHPDRHTELYWYIIYNALNIRCVNVFLDFCSIERSELLFDWNLL